MKKIALITLLAFVLTAGTAAVAEMTHDHMATEQKAETPMAKMMRDMDQPTTGDADADFIRGMIPHHEGAIAMADDVLKKGKDPEVQMLAQDIIRAQQDEIKWMRDWLRTRGIPEKGPYTAKPEEKKE